MSKQKKLIVKTTHKMMMAKHRNGLLESGLWGAHKPKVFKTKKDYTRKGGQNKRLDLEP
jgi:hypothetical protein